MAINLTENSAGRAVSLLCLTKAEYAGWAEAQPTAIRRWLELLAFDAAAGSLALLPDGEGGIVRALYGLDRGDLLWSYAALAAKLPSGRYALDGDRDGAEAERACLGWGLAGYRFDAYRAEPSTPRPEPAQLVWPENVSRKRVEALLEGIFLTRDLINTPANDMGPAELAAAASQLAERHGAGMKIVEGDDLLAQGYPAIHAVGRASSRAPRLIDMTWGSKGPLITLVGKGVCFDTGGLDLKPSGNMMLMKKDMGGAAHVLGLASYIMASGLSLRLRVLIPAVENSVSGNAYRPLDVIRTRKGLTVEIGNTDAEGRIVLADALAEASRDKPAAIFDFATLTGAARVALGPELPALFCNDEGLAAALQAASASASDPLWRLPLHRAYRPLIDGKVADLNNISSDPYAGAIIAGLFLECFVEEGQPWAHFDIMAWNSRARPGRPQGAEAMGLRAAAAALERFLEEGDWRP